MSSQPGTYGDSDDPGVQHAAGQIAVAIVIYANAVHPMSIDEHGPEALEAAYTALARRIRAGAATPLAGQALMGVDLGEANLEIFHEVDAILRGGVTFAKQLRGAHGSR